MYLFVGSFGATYVVDNINTYFFEGFLNPLVEDLVRPIPNEFIRDMIVDSDFGILTTGVFLALGHVPSCATMRQTVALDYPIDRAKRWDGCCSLLFHLPADRLSTAEQTLVVQMQTHVHHDLFDLPRRAQRKALWTARFGSVPAFLPFAEAV